MFFQPSIQILFSHHNNSEYVNELTCHYSSSSPDRPKHILMACVSFQTLDIQGPKTYKETWRRNLDYTLCLVLFLFLVLICWFQKEWDMIYNWLKVGYVMMMMEEPYVCCFHWKFVSTMIQWISENKANAIYCLIIFCTERMYQ